MKISSSLQASFQCSGKINWDLYITGLLDNGFHELDSIVAPINLYDQISICIGNGSSIEVLSDICPGKDNLAWKAAKAFQDCTGESFSVSIEIQKQIPSGAGLGGGSSDAACVIKAFNQMLGFGLTRDQMKNIGSEIGADVPCFFHNGWRRMTGIGQIVQDLEAEPRFIVLAMPDKPVSTSLAYKAFDANPIHRSQNRDRLSNPHNDLEQASISILPEISDVLSLIGSTGAQASCMTGSGSACFGVYGTKKQADEACLVIGKRVRSLSLIAGF